MGDQKSLPRAYDPKAVEDRIYKMWEASGAFRADASSKKEPFTISMPPPNATGQLHLGHAVMLALEDIFIRFARMRGKEALWIPGTDHAAIATENVVIRRLRKEGIGNPRADLGREKLVDAIRKYVEKSRGTIRSQIRKMGASCDWSRERYTLDPALNRCVNEVFKMMYKDGLIYRGQRIVNWDPAMQTNVSDDEIEYIEERAPYYTFQYGPFQISTARPETKFGDKFVVMHPDDERYKQYKDGDTFTCEWINGPITATVIKDDKVIDPSFGTGCMTITPWHDMADFDLSERRGLPKEPIIDFDGRLLPIAGEFVGMPIEEARLKVVEKLKAKGLLVKVDENYVHNIAVSYRGGGKIEPQVREQWLIDVEKEVVPWKKKTMSLKQIMQDVIHSKDISIIPERFGKVYFHWIDNLRDWCISRQIWWGHRIPVWYCGTCKEKRGGSEKIFNFQGSMLKQFVSVAPLMQCPDCGGKLEQDPDTLDTWFSSGLWTWSTLVDPGAAADFSKGIGLKEILARSPDFKKFHPTSVMETGYDILFFWVARMILMTTYATGQIPFKTVYLHGLVRTREGKKMSKSDPATCIDPLDMIEKYGADALRMSMIVGQSPGNDFRLYEEKIAGYRNFVNKLWNAARFVLMRRGKNIGISEYQSIRGKISLVDRALLSELQQLITDVTKGLEEYRLSEVGERLYSFTWDFFCDWCLEFSKGEEQTETLLAAFRTLLILLHPYCPFVTEELWSSVKPQGNGDLLTHPWPAADDSLNDEEAVRMLRILIDVITAIRGIRSEYGVEPGKKISVVLVTEKHGALLEEQQEHIKRLARAEKLTIQKGKFTEKHAASVFTKHVEIHVPLAGLIDVAKEREHLSKEKTNLEGFLKSVRAKLGNEKFVRNAAGEVVEKERRKEAEAEGKLQKIGEKLAALA